MTQGDTERVHDEREQENPRPHLLLLHHCILLSEDTKALYLFSCRLSRILRKDFYKCLEFVCFDYDITVFSIRIQDVYRTIFYTFRYIVRLYWIQTSKAPSALFFVLLSDRLSA